MPLRIGIMGFGRIGRNVFRQAFQREDIDIVAISDLAPPESMAYLLGFDTIYGRFPGEVRLDGNFLEVGRQRSRLLRAVTPLDLPWDAFGVDVVIETTHQYRTRALLQGHLESGAKRVLLTTPALDSIDRTVVHGVNEQNLRAEDHIVSCSSTTTHALALIVKVLDEGFGLERAFVTSVHAYTSDQRLADQMTDELRRSRSAAENLIPNPSWAPVTVGQLFPHLQGKVEGVEVNVPVPNGSNLDLVCQIRQEVDAATVNELVREAANGPLASYLDYANEPIVSSDVIGNDHSAVFDSLATMALPGGLLKTITWYDNGWGYARRVLETATSMGRLMRGGDSR